MIRLLIFCMFITTLNAKVILNNEEKQWIETHNVKIGVEQWTPILFSNNGYDIDGICGDFTKLIIKRTGLKVTIVADEWDTLLTDFKNKKLDILPDVFSTEKRKEFGIFSDGYVKIKDAIYVQDKNTNISSLGDLEGKTLAMQQGNGNIDKIKKRFPKIKIVLTKNLDDSINSVLNGKVEGFYAGQIAVETKIKDELINGLKAISIKAFKAPSLHFFSKINEPLLASIIQKGLKSITYQERNTILNKWLEKQDKQIDLTQEEFIYLKKKKEIKMCNNPNWEPIEFTNDGKIDGIAIDTIRLLETKLNIKFESIKTSSWTQSQEFLKDKKCDILSSAIQTTKRDKYAKFTKPYLSLPLAIFTTKDKNIVSGLDEVITYPWSRKKSSGLISKVRNKYPDTKIIETNSADEAFQLVNKGDAYFTIATLPVASNVIQKYNLSDLQIAGYSDMKYNLSIAVRDDNKILLSILDKGLNSISKEESRNIFNKWVNFSKKENIDYTIVWQIVVLSIIMLLAILYWNMKLNKEVIKKTKDLKHINENQKLIIKEQTAELQESLNTMSRYIIYSATDLQGIITEVSDAFCDISQYTRDELIGKPHNIVRHPDIPKSIFEVMWQTIQSDKVWSGEVKNLKKDGTYYWVQADISPQYDKNGNKIGYLAIRHDITAKKDFEEQHNKLFESEKLAKEKAEQSTKSKSEFLANMSHEIRTPMNGIIGMSYLALQTPLNKSQRNYIQKIDNSAKALLGIINDILDFSKIEAGKLNIEKIDFSIFKVVEQISDLIKYKVEERNIKFQVIYCHDSMKNFHGDSLRIGQILLNLVGNAIKFTTKGTVALHISRVSQDRYRFEVIDTGIGLTQEHQTKLFQSFSQADGSTTRQYGGTGLGLSISKQLVELMNGKIWCESTYGKGSKFIFDIDLEELDYIEITSSADLGTKVDEIITKDIHTLKGSDILLVEDNKINQEIILGLLGNSGIKIDIANNGQEAIDMFNKKDYELILMDLQMPIMGGIEATRIIRDTKNGKDIPIIALTANAMKEDVQRTHDVGMNEHLNKPIEVEKLYSVLLKYIETKVSVEKEGDEEKMEETIDNTFPKFKNIDTSIGMRLLLDNVKLYLKLLNTFYNDYKDIDFSTFDDEEYFRIIHTISGVSGSIGATQLHNCAKQFDITQDKAYFDEFNTQLKLVIDELKEKLQQESKANEINNLLDLTDDYKDLLFNNLKIALKTNRPHICQPSIDEIKKYQLSVEDNELFAKINTLVENYKLKDALELL
ncbi:MAG: hypothetical protein DRG78_13330 [Epsilonproteobacteria bacterium]|nr:MAG: hypothetical protein DRG78_13330 [Campylobacterota bacterium]